MPNNNMVKDNKCLVCGSTIPKDRVGNAVTCRRPCSKIYIRIHNYIRSSIISKHITENKKLKLKLKKVMENDKKIR